MTNGWKWISGIEFAIVVAIGIWMLIPASHAFGAVGVKLIENYDPYVRYNGGIQTALPFKTTSTMQIGTNGTLMNRLNYGQCYVQAYATTIAASTTAQVDCQGTAATFGLNTANDTTLTGVTLGDNVVATFATSTSVVAGAYGSITIVGASASTTSGYISLRVENLTGTTFTWPIGGNATGTVSYFVSN